MNFGLPMTRASANQSSTRLGVTIAVLTFIHQLKMAAFASNSCDPASLVHLHSYKRSRNPLSSSSRIKLSS
jgi:hypothetical protein